MTETMPVEHPIFQQLRRIFGDQPTGETSKVFAILPLVSEQEALAFLQTVPTGVSVAELVELALAYRNAHPIAIADASDREPQDENVDLALRDERSTRHRKREP